MVLHDVAQSADAVVELAPVVDAEVLCHGDLDFGDDVAMPQLDQREVAEAQVLQFDDRLLAQEVVHPEDLVLLQQRT